MLWMDWTPVWQGESRMCPDNCVIFPLHRQQSSMNIVTACVWKVYLCASSHLGICSSKNLFTLNDPTLKNAMIHTKKAEWRPTSPILEIWIQGKEGCHPNDWGLVEWGGPDDWGPGEWEASSSMNFDLRPIKCRRRRQSVFIWSDDAHSHTLTESISTYPHLINTNDDNDDFTFFGRQNATLSWFWCSIMWR